VYQIKCVEDHCVRYRLRLGPFFTEAQANAALTVVRDSYPAALTATANPTDLESFGDIKFEAPRALIKLEPPAAPVAALTPTPPAAKAPASEPVAIPQLHEAVTPSPATYTAPPIVYELELMPDFPIAGPKPPAAAAIPAVHTLLDESSILQLLTEEAVPLPPPVSTAASQRGKKSPPLTSLGYPAAKTSDLVSARGAPQPPKLPPRAATPPLKASGAGTVPNRPSTAPSAPARNTKPAIVNAPLPQAAKAPTLTAPAPRSAEPVHGGSSDLETTQTLRALTASELDNSEMLRWFVVELSCSDRPFHPDTLPNLDIFSAYRLYAVEAVNGGPMTYALRLGFFSEAIGAQAIANYLKDHYENPSVKRVSIAERERFKERRLEARKTVEATGRHAVIEITDERYVRERRAVSVS
jgi:hypothetical protein